MLPYTKLKSKCPTKLEREAKNGKPFDFPAELP
jgi:hypothetical protein